MFENVIYALPELVLISALILLPLCCLFPGAPRRILKLSSFCIVLSGFLEVVFYNKSFAEHYLTANGFCTLVNACVYLSAFAVLILARRWYASTGDSPLLFCQSLLLTVLLGNILTSSIHFAVTVAAFCGVLVVNFILLKHSSMLKEMLSGLKNYVIAAMFFGFVMLFTATVFYFENGHLAYESLNAYVAANQGSPEIFLLMFSIIVCFAFLIGLAPFNFWRTETLGQVILPVLAYFLLVPFAFGFVAFINLSKFVFGAYAGNISVICMVFAMASMLVGALGAGSGKNIHKLLAYGSLFHLGVMLLALSALSADAIDNFVIYMIIYLLSAYGIVSAFFGLKSKGEYLDMLGDLAGASVKQPYISAMMTIYLFSLIGFPPFLGFVGLYAVGYDLALGNHFYILMFLLATLMILTYSYMQFIKSLYFEKNTNNYDRTERGIYAVILINAILMVIVSLKPDTVIETVRRITENLFD